MDVSIVIPTYNRALSLGRLLGSLPEDVETIVVDDGSWDDTSRIVATYARPNLQYVHQTNKGPAAARNAGVAVARGDYLAFIDDDCVALPPWPLPLVKRLEELGAPYAAVGGRVESLAKDVISDYMTFHRILEPPDSMAYFVTANCVITRQAFEVAGGFDESIPFAGGEDPGLSQSIRQKGYRIGYTPDALVLHDYRKGIWSFVRTFYRYGRGCAHVMARRA